MPGIEGLSLLLVEDEYLIALDAEQMLRDLGAADVKIVSTLDDALDCAKRETFDLAVLDVNINGQFSFPIAEILKQSGTPVVFATGYARHDQPRAAFEGSVCVSKPYTVERLDAALRAALSGAKSPESCN